MSPVDGPARRAGRAGRGQRGWRLRAIAFAVVVLLPVAVATLAPPALASTTLKTIPVGSSPIGVAVDPGTYTAYVTNYGSDTVSGIAIDISKASQSFGAPEALALNSRAGASAQFGAV